MRQRQDTAIAAALEKQAGEHDQAEHDGEHDEVALVSIGLLVRLHLQLVELGLAFQQRNFQVLPLALQARAQHVHAVG